MLGVVLLPNRDKLLDKCLISPKRASNSAFDNSGSRPSTAKYI